MSPKRPAPIIAAALTLAFAVTQSSRTSAQRPRSEPHIKIEVVQIRGSLPRDGVTRALDQQRETIGLCFRASADRPIRVTGRMMVTASGQGFCWGLDVAGSTSPSPPPSAVHLTTCLQLVLQATRLPSTSAGRSQVTVELTAY